MRQSCPKTEEKNIQERQNLDIYNLARSLRRKARLGDLETTRFHIQDAEVRIWMVDTLFIPRTRGYVFTFRKGKWEAAQYRSDDSRALKKIVFVKPFLGRPRLQRFLEYEISPERIRNFISFANGTDESIFVVEIKVGKDYAKRIFFETDSGGLVNSINLIVRKEFSEEDIGEGK